MLLPLLVIQKGFFGDTLFQHFFRYGGGVPVQVAVEHHHFQRGQGGAGVPVGKLRHGPQKLRGHDHLLPAETARVLQRPFQQASQIVRGQGVQHKHLAPGQKRPVDLEGGVFRGGPDQHDAAFFHKGQERVLLGLVEAVDFVYKYDGLFAVQGVMVGALHHLADLLDAAGDGGKVDELCLRPVGDNAGQRGLAHARRAPEDHGGNMVALDQPPKHLSRSQQVSLPHKFLQALGPKPGRQRLHGLRGGKKVLLFHGFPPAKSAKNQLPFYYSFAGKEAQVPQAVTPAPPRRDKTANYGIIARRILRVDRRG